MALTDDQRKAADFVVESLKAVLTISTLLLAALGAFVSTTDLVVPRGLLASALAGFLVTSILCIVNINTLINIVHYGGVNTGEKERETPLGVRQKSVRFVNFGVLLALLGSLILGSVVVARVKPSPETGVANQTQIIRVGDSVNLTIKGELEITVTTGSDGELTGVEIVPFRTPGTEQED